MPLPFCCCGFYFVCEKTFLCVQWGSKWGQPASVWQQLRWKQERLQPRQDVSRQDHVEHPGTSIIQTLIITSRVTSYVLHHDVYIGSVCDRMTSPEFSPSTRAPTALAAWTPPPAWPKESPASLWLLLLLLTTGRQHLHPLSHIQCNPDYSQDLGVSTNGSIFFNRGLKFAGSEWPSYKTGALGEQHTPLKVSENLQSIRLCET